MPASDRTGRTNGQSSSDTKTLRIKITSMRADKVPTVSSWRTGRFLVRVQVDEDTENTAVGVAGSDWVSWTDELHFDIPRTSIMRLTLLAPHRVRRETIVGWVEERIDASVRSGLVKRRLHEAGTISFHVQLLPSHSPCASDRRAVKSQNGQAHNLAAGMQVVMRTALHLSEPPEEKVDPESKTTPPEGLDLGNIDDLSDSSSQLLQHVDLFVSVISRISEVVAAQRERDDRFRQLIKVTSDVFVFATKLEMSVLEGHRRTIKLLVLQTTECAYFVRDYTKQKSFIIRAGSTFLSGGAINDKIAEYEKKSQDLKAAFLLDSALNTEIAVLRIAEQIDRIVMRSADISQPEASRSAAEGHGISLTAGELDDLPYAAARFDREKQCLEGTREAILEKIFTLKLCLADDAIGLTSFVGWVLPSFFSGKKPERSPDRVFTTIARDMADLDQGWEVALKQVAAPRALRRTESIREQFEEFILKPARRLPVYFGPVVIVIDALDAVGNTRAGQTLISLLALRISELPSNFRIIITARLDTHIRDAFRDHKGIEWWPMDTAIEDWEKSNLEDIEKFFNTELSSIVGSSWSPKLCHKLVQISEGDFGWATSACAFIKSTHGRLDSPADRVRHLISYPIAVDWAAEEFESESESGWPLHPPQTYPDTDMRSFPVMPQRPSHVKGPLGPWLPIDGVGPYYAPGLIGEPEYY
ncbi:hypothetical protein B0H14DRAFT_2626019 [Mycena olivaceomarginata]|nr:hypothetical protein B0H14DRAFT_2626019 [Mycena olivaceomarginata]